MSHRWRSDAIDVPKMGLDKCAASPALGHGEYGRAGHAVGGQVG